MAVAMASLILGSAGCVYEADELEEYKADDLDQLEDEELAEAEQSIVNYGDANLRIVTFNIHGAGQQSLETFKTMLTDNDRILVLQEVTDIAGMRAALASEFPYEFITTNDTAKIFDNQTNHVVVRSKLPIVYQDSSLIQTDPGGDKWRRYAQYVRIKVRDDVNIKLFHYHNTYNWHNNNSQYEKSGMQSFKTWVESKVGALSAKPDKVFMTGDFNLEKDALDDILGTGLTYQSHWVDHVVSTNATLLNGGFQDSSAISDHDMVWTRYSMTTNITTAEANVVRLYEHSNLGGLMTAFGRGDYADIGASRGEWWNDKVSSMTVGGKVKIHAWQHGSFGGTKWCLPTDGACGSSGYNDQISSFKVMTR